MYQGQTSILVGVSLGLEKPATAVIVDASTDTVLAYRSLKQLLDCIHTQATKAKIPLEQGTQPIRGNPQEKARSLAIATYHSVKINLNLLIEQKYRTLKTK